MKEIIEWIRKFICLHHNPTYGISYLKSDGRCVKCGKVVMIEDIKKVNKIKGVLDE